MKNTIIQTCKNKESQNNPIGMNLFDWCITDKFKSRVEAIRKCEDKNERDILKGKLPVAVPSLQINGNHSGFIAIDVDGKDNPGHTPAELKEIISSIKQISFCGYSASGGGVWGLVPIFDTAKHLEHFEALEHCFKCIGVKIDNKCTNINRLRFASYDPEPYVNENAETFRLIMVDVPDPKEKQKPKPKYGKGENVFEKFNQEADVIGLLIRNGWKIEKVMSDKTHLTRPGKKGGVSGTLFNDTKIFHLFTSNSGLSKTDYNPFDLYAELEYNNDKERLLRELTE